MLCYPLILLSVGFMSSYVNVNEFSVCIVKKKNKVTYEGLFYQLFVLKIVYERKKGQLIKSLFSTSVYFFVRHGGVEASNYTHGLTIKRHRFGIG